ncbi:MAG TPA: hypothetical protein VM305_04535, partial [Candidatus Limnocylindrales bacterium]|nr:hypothetical protein [Candidatus Limnocylindrales bacterium]
MRPPRENVALTSCISKVRRFQLLPKVTWPEPTPGRTPFEVEVRQGPGHVTFGSSWNRRTLEMQDVSATFSRGGRIAWSAILSEPAGAPALTVEAARLDIEQDTEDVTWEELYEMQNQQSERILRRVPINRLTGGQAGIYVVRYLRDEEVLAEGYFELVDPNAPDDDEGDTGDEDEGD